MYTQLYDYDCGAAAIYYIASQFKLHLPAYKDFISFVQCDKQNGTSPQLMLTALKKLHIKCTSFFMMDISLLIELLYNGYYILCPIQSGIGHWVVVCGITNRSVYIFDPAHGKRKVPINQFIQNWYDVGPDGTEYYRYGIACIYTSTLTDVADRSKTISQLPIG
jgi:ABC-type bacteriocin/lantibiotic exporter with double-glycine peptidase domain